MSYVPEATTFEPPADAEAFYAESLRLLKESLLDIQTHGQEMAQNSRGLSSRSRMEWQGNSLLLTVLIDAPRGLVSNVVRYELLDDGRTLRAVEDVGGAAPPHHNVWMFARR